MTLTIALLSVAALLALAAIAPAIARTNAATLIIYATTLAITTISLAAAAIHLLNATTTLSLTLPLGLPWLGAHFRLDALSAFFVVVVDLGALSASLFALGYGEHERAPQRVLPFDAVDRLGRSVLRLFFIRSAHVVLFNW